MRKLYAIVFVMFLFAGFVQAQEETAPAAQNQQQQTSASAQQQPVATYTLPPDKYEKAVAYSRAKYRLYFADVAYGIIVLLLILGLKIASRFRQWAEHASSRRWLQVMIFAPLLLLLIDAVSLPSGIYGHWLSRKYEQSIQGWGSWMWDWTKGELIGLVVGTFLVWLLFVVIRRSPRRWWFYFWLVSLPIILVTIFLVPVIIDPLFNKFEPLAKSNPELVAQIERVVERSGLTIPRDRMFLMKASEKTNSLNAYVTGLGASKRVVVWDTTIRRMTTPETLFVFGHELGHYVLNHIYKGIAFTALMLFIGLYLAYRVANWMLARWAAAWGLRDLNDWAALPVLLLILAIFGFVASPIGNGFSRWEEHQADIYGLEVTHGLFPDSTAVATHSFQVLGEIDLSDPKPSPFIKFWLYSHPPIDERIQFAHDYAPWSQGKQPEFVK